MPYFITGKLFLLSSFDISEKEKRKLNTFLEILERSNVFKIIEKEVVRDINVGRKSYKRANKSFLNNEVVCQKEKSVKVLIS